MATTTSTTKTAARKRAASTRAAAPARRAQGPTVTPVRSSALVLADDPPPADKLVVGLQATITISGNSVTLETPDISTISKGIQFQLAEPVPLGSLTDFLTWAAKEIPGFPSGIDPSTWPDPFNGLAAMIVTIERFCINNQVTPATYTIAVTMKADPAKPVKIPVIPVTIEGFGVSISKGDCAASITPAAN